MTTKVIKRYLHASNDELSDLWGPEASQQERYHYTLYEVAIDLEVDLDTGKSRIVKVNGVPLQTIGEFR